MKVPRMSRVERRQLIRLGRRSGDPYTALRFQAVARLGTGSSTPQVAAELDIATSTVVGAADRFLADGVDGLYDRRRGNGARKADERFDRVLVRLLGRTPQDFGWQRPTWTRELLCLQMKLEGFPAVAVCTMGRALSRVGARLGTPKPIVLCPWPRDRRLRVLAAIRRLEARASAEEPVLYSDEVDIHLNPKIGRDWMLRGHQRRIVTPGKNQKFYLAGALDVRTGRLHTTGAASKNAALFCQLLWLLASRYRRAAAYTSSSTTTASTRRGSRARPSPPSVAASCCTSCRPTAPTPTASSASGRTSTPTSPATTAARPWTSSSTAPAATSTATVGGAPSTAPSRAGRMKLFENHDRSFRAMSRSPRCRTPGI